MSIQNVAIKQKNRRSWFLVVLLVGVLLVAGAACSLGSDAAPETPAAVWTAQEIDDYQYTVQVSCFCLREATRPVVVEVKDGRAVSLTYADDGTAADPALFARYDSIDKIFDIISEAEAQEPARLDVTYDEATGVPQSIAIDISEQMADEELYLEIREFEALAD